MKNNKQHKKSRLMGWIISAILILALFIGGRLLLKSDWLFSKLRNITEVQVNQQIRGNLSIGSIRGDLLHGFTIQDITVHDSLGTEVIGVDSLLVQYELFSILFSPHSIQSLEVFGSELLLEQYADSSWNALQLIPPSDQTTEESDPFLWFLENAHAANTNVEIRSSQYLPDESLTISNLTSTFSAGVVETGISGNLRELEFSIREGRLPESIEVYLEGAARDNQYTLDSIVINSGRSMLRGSASYEDGELEQSFNLSPLSWQDISEYTAQSPVEQDVEIELGINGTLNDLQITLDATATGLQQLQVSAHANLKDMIALTRFNITAMGFDSPLLTGIEDSPVIDRLMVDGKGVLLLQTPMKSNWEGSLETEGLRYKQYEMDQLQTDYSFDDGSVSIDGSAEYQNEIISLSAEVDSLFENQPGWEFHLNTNQCNPAVWLKDDRCEGNIKVKIDAIGRGFDPNNFSGSADVIVSGREMLGQPFSNLSLKGSFDQDQIFGKVVGRLQESRANVNFTILGWQAEPEYEFEFEMSRLNLAEFNGLEQFPTFLNGTIEGKGRSFNPTEIAMTATANFDSSIVNGELIEQLNTDLSIENEFLIIDNGSLQSPIADAMFSLDHHIFEITNRSNRLNFRASLKDLQPLAPLFDVNTLQSEGTVNGNLGRNNEGILEFNGDLDLENVVVDTLFNTRKASGRLISYIVDDPEFDITVELSEPTVFHTSVQDIQLYAYAKKQELQTNGNVSLKIINGEDSSLLHSGEFTIDSTKTSLTTNQLTFQSHLRQLTLEEPFDLTYSNRTLEVDTLMISTDNGEAFLQFWAPRIDSLNQQAGLSAQNLNIGVLQQTILKESYFDGHLNGSLSLHNTLESLQASLAGNVTNLKFSDGVMDSLSINMDLKDEWLNLSLESWHQNKRLADGSFRVPYLPSDPLTFDDQFFERQVEGSFNVSETELRYWLSFLPDGAPEQTRGTVVLESGLGGVAGNPDLEGHLKISNGVFSGIQVDTVGIDISYLHENEHVEFSGSIIKDQRRILDFHADLPFLVDLKRAEVNIPSGSDELFVDLQTNNFDLALLNSYVNRDLVRNVSGRLEGAVQLLGAIDNLQAEGEMQLTRGAMRIVPAGISLTDISSNILFNRETVELQRFTTTSGPGRVRANGTIEMKSLEPQQMDITITANRFRLLNTTDYRANINMNATLSGTASEPRLMGNLTFLNGFYFLQNFGQSAVEAVELDDEASTEYDYDFYNALNLEMTINFDRDFFVRNRQYLDMQIEMGGQVDLVKEPGSELEMFGSLEGVNGYARPLGKQFNLEEALVTFYGPTDNPELQVRTRYTPPQSAGVQIFYIIEGTLEKPEFRFESQPELELQDILSYTLFGRPFYELESWEQVVAGSSNSPTAADYALEVVLDRVEMLASRRLGIDVVQIDNTNSGSNNTVIKTGWYLNPSTFFAIWNEIDGTNPKTLFVLEILLKENLELIITQGDDTQQGIDLQWKRDY